MAYTNIICAARLLDTGQGGFSNDAMPKTLSLSAGSSDQTRRWHLRESTKEWGKISSGVLLPQECNWDLHTTRWTNFVNLQVIKTWVLTISLRFHPTREPVQCTNSQEDTDVPDDGRVGRRKNKLLQCDLKEKARAILIRNKSYKIKFKR